MTDGLETLPPHRSPNMAIKTVALHVQFHLDNLHAMCERSGLSAETEEAIRLRLERELEDLSQLPQELSIQETIELGEKHFANSDAINEIKAGTLAAPE